MKKVRPIVAMNSVICGWLTSGRSTNRSTMSASTIITASVARTARRGGIPCSSSPTYVSAAKNTIALCAKLNTPDAL